MLSTSALKLVVVIIALEIVLVLLPLTVKLIQTNKEQQQIKNIIDKYTINELN